jgi:pimeloyl-ACP methyl ester carboxylesterase
VAPQLPEGGYSVPELAEDVWRVIQSLHIVKPVVVGHSMAASEVSFLGQKHSPDLTALIYLDGNADSTDYPWSNAEYRALTTKHASDAVAAPKRNAADGRASVSRPPQAPDGKPHSERRQPFQDRPPPGNRRPVPAGRVPAVPATSRPSGAGRDYRHCRACASRGSSGAQLASTDA